MIARLARGTINPQDFTPEMAADFGSDAKTLSDYLGAQGPLDRFYLLGHQASGSLTEFQYLGHFRDGGYFNFSFSLTSEGKIAKMGFQS